MLPPSSDNSGAGSVPGSPAFNLVNQAYANMLAGNYSLAETQYKSLTEMEPDNLASWEGLLWSLNAQGKYSSTLKLGKKLHHDKPGQAFYYNYLGYALLNSHRFPAARYYYQKGLQSQPGMQLANQISREGMAYAYRNLDDYPHYYANLNSSRQLSSTIQLSKSVPALSTTLAYKVPGADKAAYIVKQGISYRRNSLNLAYENLFVGGEQYRHILRSDIRTQLYPLDIGLQGRILKGDDDRVYPAWQVGAELSPRFYPGQFAIKPSLFASYSHHPDLDAQQLSFKPRVSWRDMNLSYALNATYLDYENPGADSLNLFHQFELTKSLPYGFGLGLAYGFGNDAWSVDNTGNSIDTFSQNGSYYGASLSKSLFGRFSAYAYYQKWESDQLLYFSLTGRY